MLTESKREYRRRTMEAACDQENSPKQKSKKQPKQKRRSWKLLLAVAFLGAIVWFLPVILVQTPLLQWAVNKAAAQLNGSVSIGSASLGWLSPVAVQNVEIKDAEGKPVLALSAAGLNRSLWALAWDYTNLGKIRIENPKIDLVLRNDGSNIEDLLKQYLTPQESEPAAPSTKIGLSVEMIDAALTVTDQQTGRTWQVQKLNMAFDMPNGPAGSMSAIVSGDILDPERPGKLSAAMKLNSAAGEVKCTLNGLPLAVFRALAERFSPGTTCDGRLTADLVASWGSASGKNSVQADLRTEALAVSSPLLKTDVLQLDQLHGICQASWQADRIEIEQSSIDCDVGNVSLTSAVKLPETNGMSLDALLHQQYELTGQVDVARAARLLPATLRLREQVDIQSGRIEVAVSSKSESSGMVWKGRLNADKLTAVAAGRQIAWQQPILLDIDVHETKAGPEVDQLKCESDFLKMHASGSPDKLVASLTFNLKQLSDQLGQFVDLGSLQLEGEGWGNLNWERDAQQQFSADTELRFQHFQLGLPDQPAWREENLLLLFAAKGQTDLSYQTRIDAASLKMKSGGDEIDLRLTKPIQGFQNGGTWPVRIDAKGDLQNWPARLAAWAPTKDCRLSGGYTLAVDGTAAKDSIQLREVKLEAAPLVVASPWINMNEPKLELSAAGSWDQTQRRLQIEPCRLNCATAALNGNNLLLAMPENGAMELTGTVQYQGDAARLRQWFADPAKPSTWKLAGRLRGDARLHQTGGVIRGETNAEVLNLAVVDSSGQQFQEPRIQLAANGDYDNQSGVIQLAKFKLTSSALAAGAAGRVSPAAGVKNADFNGQIGYDLERIAGLMRPYIGSGVRIVGRGSSPAWYRGPFDLGTSQAEAAFRWDWANIYGLQVGPGEFKAAMANGLLQIQPLDLAVSRGRMHLAPTVRMTPEPMELSLPGGPLAQQIQIDPVMCASMLKYIAPVLADVATAQGSFSVDLGEGCRVPLATPAQSELAGRFTVHSIEVGPGPLVRALAMILGRESPAKLRHQSVVQFRMVGGRIYHQGLELEFPDITVRTYGSVGLDQTMAIMAEMPVPPKWVENNPTAAQALRGQTIKIPINGTLSKPQVDQRVLQDLTRQFMQKAAENVIEGELNKQLDRLFGPRK